MTAAKKTLTVTGMLPDGVTVEYTANTLTDAGSVEVTASFTGDTKNYNEIDPMTATLTIERAVPAYTLPEGLRQRKAIYLQTSPCPRTGAGRTMRFRSAKRAIRALWRFIRLQTRRTMRQSAWN